MSLYIIVLAILCLGALYEGFVRKKSCDGLYFVLFIIMAAMLCLRYGQGTDYLSYKYTYVNLPNFNNIEEVINDGLHGELGWKLICSLCNNVLKMSYEMFVVIISIFEMYALNRFIKSYCPRKVLALAIFYPTFFLTYYFSALRQGIVLSAFIGFLLKQCIQKKYIRYCISVVLLALVHSSALALLVVPPIYCVKIDLKKSVTIVAECFLLGCIIGFTSVKTLLPYSSSSFSLLAIAERVVSFIVVVTVCAPAYNQFRKEGSHPVFIGIANVYIFGIMLYGLFISSDLLAARVIIYFKCMELVLFGMAASNEARKGYQLAYTYSVLLAIIMTVKNIGSYIQQLDYLSHVTIMNFPYVTLFDPGKIWDYANNYFVNYFH